jgi:hypothetical protein
MYAEINKETARIKSIKMVVERAIKNTQANGLNIRKYMPRH